MAERANRSGHGPMGHGSGMPVEKAKDFKGTLGKMMTYMSSYRPALIVVMIFAVASTVFNVALSLAQKCWRKPPRSCLTA